MRGLRAEHRQGAQAAGPRFRGRRLCALRFYDGALRRLLGSELGRLVRELRFLCSGTGTLHRNLQDQVQPERQHDPRNARHGAVAHGR